MVKKSFVGKPVAFPAQKPERKIIEKKVDIDEETKMFLNYFGEDLKTQLLETALQNGNTELKGQLDEVAAEFKKKEALA